MRASHFKDNQSPPGKKAIGCLGSGTSLKESWVSSGTGAFVERSGAVVDLGRSSGEFGGNGGFVLSDGTRMSEAVQAIRRYEVMPRSFPRGKWPRADGSPIHPFVNPRLGRLDLRGRLEPRPAIIGPPRAVAGRAGTKYLLAIVPVSSAAPIGLT